MGTSIFREEIIFSEAYKTLVAAPTLSVYLRISVKVRSMPAPKAGKFIASIASEYKAGTRRMWVIYCGCKNCTPKDGRCLLEQVHRQSLCTAPLPSLCWDTCTHAVPPMLQMNLDLNLIQTPSIVMSTHWAKPCKVRGNKPASLRSI